MAIKLMVVLFVLVMIVVGVLFYYVISLEENNNAAKAIPNDNKEKLRDQLGKIRDFKETCTSELKPVCQELIKEILNGISSSSSPEDVRNRCLFLIDTSFQSTYSRDEDYLNEVMKLLDIFK